MKRITVNTHSRDLQSYTCYWCAKDLLSYADRDQATYWESDDGTGYCSKRCAEQDFAHTNSTNGETPK